MRKKYLSALLFGALLVTSAGTFTSCKDYDDEINDLQEQINTINTTLTELKGQIGDKGVSSVTFDEATGKLTVVDANGTTSYTIKTSAETVVEAEINEEGVLVINGEEIGKVADGGDTVTVEGDKLLVNGKEVATLGGGEACGSIFKDEATHTVTITIDGESVTLPYGADAGVTPTVSMEGRATWDVAWGVAEEKIEWNGTEIAAGSLLLGGMTLTPEVTVDPITYDLSAQTLKLVDLDGKYAEVNVDAVCDEFNGTTNSRAASHNGKWNIKLTATDKVTADNVTTIFTKKVNGVDLNVAYALEVNGTRVTGYDFVIDTQTENENANNTKLGDNTLSVVKSTVNTGTTTLEVSNNMVVSSYLKLEGLAASEGEAYGISVDGMNITAGANAVGRSITVKLYALDVTGHVSTHNITVDIAKASTEVSETVKQVECAISADGKFTVDFGTIFEGLSSDIVLNAKNVVMTTAEPNFFALADVNKDANNMYPISAGVTLKNAKDGKVDFGQDLRTITKAEIKLNKFEYVSSEKKWYPETADKAGTVAYRTCAKFEKDLYGIFNINLTLVDENSNALKNIIVPVKVVAPKFEDYFKKNTNALWVDGGVTRDVVSDFDGNLIAENNADKLFLDSKNNVVTGNTITYTYSYKATNDKQTPEGGIPDNEVCLNAGNVADATYYPILSVVKNAAGAATTRRSLGVSKLTVNANSLIALVAYNKDGEENASCISINAKTTFPLTLTTKYANPKLVYYVNDKATDLAIVDLDGSNENKIVSYAEFTTGVKLKPGAKGDVRSDYTQVTSHSGLAIEFGDDVLPYKRYISNTDPWFVKLGTSNYWLSDITFDDDDTWSAAANKEAAYSQTSTTSNSLGKLTTPSSTEDIKFETSSIKEGEGGTIEVEFVDQFGIVTKASIAYKAQKQDDFITPVVETEPSNMNNLPDSFFPEGVADVD